MPSAEEISSIEFDWLQMRGVPADGETAVLPAQGELVTKAWQFFDQMVERVEPLCPPLSHENVFKWCAANRPDLTEFLNMLVGKWEEAVGRLAGGDAAALGRAGQAAEALEFCLVTIFWAYRKAHGLSLAPLKPWRDRVMNEQGKGVDHSEIADEDEGFEKESGPGMGIVWAGQHKGDNSSEKAAGNSPENNSRKEEEGERVGDKRGSGYDEVILTDQKFDEAESARQLSLFSEEGFEGDTGGKDKPSPTGAAERSDAASAFRSPWADWLDGVQVGIIHTLDGWKHAVAEAKSAGVCGVDTETTGLDPHINRLRLIQLAVPVFSDDVPKDRWHLVKADRNKIPQKDDWKYPAEGTSAVSYVLDLFSLEEKEGWGAAEEAVRLLEDLVAGEEAVKIFHNAAFDLSFLRVAVGHRIKVCRIFDTMLASQLCTAGDFIPESQLPGWCEKNGVTVTKSKTGKTLYLDHHGHELKFEHDTQKKIRPVYPTHSLQQVAHRHLELWMEKEGLQDSDWSVAELSKEQLIYAGKDAAVLLPLREILRQLLVGNKLLRVAQIEFDCIPAVVEIETSGMPFDAEKARRIKDDALVRFEEHRKRLAEIARENGFKAPPKKSQKKRTGLLCDLNPDSSVDVVECLRILGDREGILDGDRFMVGDEEFPIESMDDTLARLSSRLSDGSPMKEFIENLREYRSAKKTYDFTKKWLELMHPTTGRLHPLLRQINPQGVGRFSASNPNLQQCPRGSEIRALFRSLKNRKLVVADYSNIEMRIMGELSKDKNLIGAFRKGADVHRLTAAAVSGKPEKDITKEERQAAKSVNFGSIYGMQAPSLRLYAETSYGVKMTLEEATAAREAFFRAYPNIAVWHTRQDKKAFESSFLSIWRHDYTRGIYAEKRPCIRTLSGRLRVWPVVERERRDGSGTYVRKVGAFTELYNSPDQGTGADIIKLAMSLLYQELLARGWDDVFMVGCVHDELVLEAPVSKAEEMAGLLSEVMKTAGRALLPDVPVEVEGVVADSWAEK